MLGETPSASSSSGPADERAENRPSGGLRMRNWRLRTKLLVVLLVPTVAALVFGAFQVVSDYNQAQQLLKIRQQVTLDASADNVVQELQRERDLTVAHIAAGRNGNRSQLVEQRSAVDDAVEELRNAVEQAEQANRGQIVEPYRQALGRLDRLQALRTVTDETSYPATAALRAYSDSVDNLISLGEKGVTRINNPEVSQLYLATNAIARAKEQESVKRARLLAALESGEFGVNGQRQLLTADAGLRAAMDDFRKWADNSQVQTYEDTVAGLAVDKAHTLEETALVRSQDGGGVGNLDPQEWMRTSTELVNRTYQVETQLRDQLQSKTNSLAGAARTQTYVAVVVVLSVLVLAFAIALFVARSLLLPLRTLRRSALNVADNRLPEAVQSILDDENPDLATRSSIDPIPVHTTEEIGRVARSFDAVHAQALRLASEQALLRNNVNDLFVNLARRSQTLVQRQLSLIDRLEQDEQDPDQLSQLFELDHLATRMRRNNENLLILGGTDLTRRTVRPVPLAEVIGAAVSEVEQYARVAIGETPDLAMQGRVVNDIVHLIAELLENATVYSNPDTEVSVRSAYRRQELVLEIRDRGVGVDVEQLDEINDRLVRPPDIDVSVSRRMGLYVVGQLARRHNVTVELENNGDLEGGATATVRLPGELIVQLTPNGPMPMPDVPRGDQPREGTTDTGAHSGLAAAFGTAGGDRNQLEHIPGAEGFASGENAEQDSAESSAAGQRELDRRDSEEFLFPEEESAEDVEQQRAPAEPPNYSVQLSSGAAYGATEVPLWEDHGDSTEGSARGADHFEREWPDSDWSAMDWPDSDATAEHAVGDDATDYQGQCGPPPGVGEPADLFHSPFETEKTDYLPWPVQEPDPREAAAEPLPEPTEDRQERAVPPLGSGPPPGSTFEADDAPTERLPIYEAVLSQWFREEDEDQAPSTSMSAFDRSTELPSDSELVDDAIGWSGGGPANGSFEGGEVSHRDGYSPVASGSLDEAGRSADVQHANGSAESHRGDDFPPEPRPEEEQHRSAAPLPNPSAADGETTARVPDEHSSGGDESGSVPGSGPANAMQAFSGRRAATREQRNRAADARQAGNDPGWGAGDEGWEAAEALVQQTEQEPEQTSAGLPKRRPKSHLVPGSAAQPQSQAPSKPAVPRSASAVRGRMSNFQQGVRRGRHAKVEPDSTEQSRSIPSRHEEQE
ncbi:signal transduction histidine kinase [Actinopolyspora biskrensis]|uniref:histidine kinase n=1 Tax=Actinopolyspora biskrensis TaxID=1470178 RepID=A0A852YWW2_9ACTN|nr:signal transduction histidine kinase [Actinopolyspora biskrensis]